MEAETTYTVEEAATLLDETPERVLEMLATGELDGIHPGATLSGEWKVLLSASLGEEQSLPVEETPSEDRGEAAIADGEAEQFIEPPQSTTDAEVESADAEVESADAASRPEASAAPVRVSDESPDEPLREPGGNIRDDGGGSGWTTTKQAAKVLGVSRRSVQGYVRRGLLEAQEEGEGVNKTFLISIDSLNALRNRRSREASASAKFAEASAEEERSANLYANAGEALRHAIERVEARTAEATELRIRLELTAQAESTLRAELEEERRRRQEAERERDELRRLLEEASREAPREPRESPASPVSSESPTEVGRGVQGPREATQTAAETLRGPEPRPTTGGAQEGLQRPAQPGRRRGALWRRVFGR